MITMLGQATRPGACPTLNFIWSHAMKKLLCVSAAATRDS